MPHAPLFTEWAALIDVVIFDALAIAMMLIVPAMVALSTTIILIVTLGLPIFLWIRGNHSRPL